jgi:hypothetical protein
VIDTTTILSEARRDYEIAEARMLRARAKLHVAEALRKRNVKAEELIFRLFFLDHFKAQLRLKQLTEMTNANVNAR